MTRDLLFELGTEELPSAAVKQLSQQLADNFIGELKTAGLNHGDVKVFATPRRLALRVHDLATQQAEQNIFQRGPAVSKGLDEAGEPTKALLGFAKSCGVEVSALSRFKNEKGEWFVYQATQAGRSTQDLLPSLIQSAVAKLSMSKPMRWGSGSDEFARPVHWALLLYGNTPVKMDLLGVTTSNVTHGHRYHHPSAMVIETPEAYEAKLESAKVIADFEQRKALILKQTKDIAATKALHPIMPDALVEEVTSIVEWPVALLATFDESFLEVPAEALIKAMQSHQKCFAMNDANQLLQPYFVTISNIESFTPQAVVRGNEKVMRARLSDAAFFYEQDKKSPLTDYAKQTSKVVFQEKLGTLQDKAKRIQAILEWIATPFDLDTPQLERAALLSKADLMTGMVGEFPDLQGLLGYYYALNDNESEAVAKALFEQYLPRYSGDALPETNLGLALSLADRIDTLVGIFGIKQKPSGVKDPFKLRRHALAVVRILKQVPYEINVSSLIDAAADFISQQTPIDKEEVKALKSFILDRAESYYQSQAIPSEVVRAVYRRQNDWLYNADLRIQALLEFLKLPAAKSLAAACKRVSNILNKTPLQSLEQSLDPHLFEQAEEINLHEKLQSIETEMRAYCVEGAYTQGLTLLAGLREDVDAFFDHVMVMVDNDQIKQNRLLLLKQLQTQLQGIADISMLTMQND